MPTCLQYRPLYPYCQLIADIGNSSFLQSNLSMDKLQLTGQALGRVFNFRSGCMHTMHLLPSVAIQPNLELKTRPKQLLGSLPLVIALPDLSLLEVQSFYLCGEILKCCFVLFRTFENQWKAIKRNSHFPMRVKFAFCH